MKDKDKTKEILSSELQKMRECVSELKEERKSYAQMNKAEPQHTDTRLKDSEERYRFLTEKMNDLIWTMDLKLRTTFVSPSIEKMLGFTPEERMTQEAKQQLTPASYKLAKKALAEELKNELSGKADPNRTRVVELEYFHKDGSIRVLENLICGLRNEKGKLIGLHGVSRDITERKNAERKLRKSLEEKEILLKEINHRVKNNLNMINSLINMQAGKIKTKKQAVDALQEVRNRIRSIAAVHEKLYQSDVFTTIEMKDYITNLAETLLQFHKDSKKIDCYLRIDDIRMDINKAIPCGLILNELISNVVKHAFPNSEEGKIVVSMQQVKRGACEIRVKDNGIGLKGNIENLKTDSMGFELVTILTDQLEGKLSVNTKDGTEFKVLFPIKNNI